MYTLLKNIIFVDIMVALLLLSAKFHPQKLSIKQAKIY